MATIDIKGLLGGKRILKCSTEARWHFPYYYLLSNCYARIELDYEAIANHFISFRGNAPSPEDVEKDFEEYRKNHLIFVYTSNRKTWGQWYTRRDQTLRHKDAASKRSPHPPEDAYQAWLKEQHPEDWGLYHWSSTPSKLKLMESDTSEKFGKVQKSSEDFGKVPRGVGVGVGGGGGKTNPLTPLNSEPENIEQKTGGPAAQVLDMDSKTAGQAVTLLLGISGWQNGQTAKDACEAVKRRKTEMRYTDIPEFIQALWREYDAMPSRGKVSLKTFLGEIGRFIDSDNWKVQSRAGPSVDEYGGHFEGKDYITKDGKRMPGYIPPPKPKTKEIF